MAGNATMTSLLLGIDPEPLGVAPFVMPTAHPPVVLAAEVGLRLHPRARLALFPALGAYVGGDIVAGMLATGMDRDKRTRLFVDVGTNCEIVLSDGETILSTAAPAGPAFEGGAIRCGMRAADGAIEVIKLDAHAAGHDPAVTLGVIGDVEAKGLCGSGLVDAVAELVRVGLLDSTGRLVPDEDAKEIAPALADRFGPKPVTVSAFLAATGCLLLLSLRLDTAVLLFAVAIAGLGSVGTKILVNGYVAVHYPAAVRATALGWALGVGRAGAIVGPLFGGWVAGSGLGFEWNFYGFALPALAGLVFIALVPRPARVRAGAVAGEVAA